MSAKTEQNRADVNRLSQICIQIPDSGALAAAASGGDVQQAPGEAPQSGGDSRNAQTGGPNG